MRYEDQDTGFRPRIGGRGRREKSPSLLSIKIPKGINKGRWPRAAYIKEQPIYYRRVMVKTRIVKMNAYGKKAALLNLKYIERGGVERDGSEGRLYGRNENFERNDFNRVIPDEKHQFRIIVSPENGQQLDLTSYTKTLMSQVEKDIGKKVEWAAVNHYNTDHPHTHIIIRGVDLKGNILTIDPQYISEGMRRRAQEIATQELGQRTENERMLEKQQEINAGKYTKLDWQLSNYEQEGIIDLGECPSGIAAGLQRACLSARMDKLEAYGLAERIGNSQWKVQDKWKETLKEMGKREEIFRTIHKAANGDPQRYRINTSDREVQGMVLSKGLDNELYDRYYMIVQEANGFTHYYNLDNKTDPDSIIKGTVISVRTELDTWLKKADHNIAAEAAANNGIYSPEMHLARIGSSTVTLNNGTQIDAGSFVEAHERRLLSLQSYRLAVKLPDGDWQVHPKLIDKLILKTKEEGPIKKFNINPVSSLSLQEEITYRGRTWLDRFVDNPDNQDFSHYGFGKELSTAVKRRVMILREMGVDPMDPGREKHLDKLEKNDAAERIAKRGGQFRQLRHGERLSGLLTELPQLPSGRKYAQISDPKSKEFAVVPWQKDFDKLKGKTVELINHAGRHLAKEISRTIGR